MFSPLVPNAPAPTDNSVKDVTLASFKADVLEASRTSLVLVVFWALGDPSCQQLVSTLDKLARATKGTVKLAKIDIDRNQSIAQQMGVQSIPSVFAFHQGRPVDAFAGVLAEAQAKTWIEQLIHATGVVGGDDKAGLDVALKQAADFLAAKDIEAAQSIYADILDMDPANAAAYAGMVRCLIASGDIAKARQMLDAVPTPMAKDKMFEPIRAAIELAEQAGSADGETSDLETKLAQNPADHQARFDLAMAYYAAGKREAAVDQLLDIVQRARTWNDAAARKQLVKFFEAFGNADPLTIAARKRLSSILFS